MHVSNGMKTKQKMNSKGPANKRWQKDIDSESDDAPNKHPPWNPPWVPPQDADIGQHGTELGEEGGAGGGDPTGTQAWWGAQGLAGAPSHGPFFSPHPPDRRGQGSPQPGTPRWGAWPYAPGQDRPPGMRTGVGGSGAGR
jgi:hypothetical protein